MSVGLPIGITVVLPVIYAEIYFPCYNYFCFSSFASSLSVLYLLATSNDDEALDTSGLMIIIAMGPAARCCKIIGFFPLLFSLNEFIICTQLIYHSCFYKPRCPIEVW